MIRTFLLLLLLVAPVLADLRFEDYRARYGNDDDALAAAIYDAKAGRGGCVIRWYGQITLTREPPPLDRVHLWGDDIQGAVVAKRFIGGVLFRFAGRPGFSGGGLHNFSVTGTPELAGSYIVYARGTPDWGPHCLQLENLYLGAGAYRAIEIVGYGNPGVSGLGARQVRIENVTCFATQSSAALYFENTADLLIIGLRCYPERTNAILWGPGNDKPQIVGPQIVQ